MRRKDRAATIIRVAALVLALALPTLTLVPFGSLWLWQNGYLLPWGLCTAALMGLVFLWQWWLFSRAPPEAVREAATAEEVAAEIAASADPEWTLAEQRAWADVVGIARATDPESLNSREALIAAAGKTVSAVAHRLHPEVAEPLWQFTVPEALAIIERVSQRLGLFFEDTVPFSDRLTVARVLTFYRWRGSVDLAERAYDVWRVIRMANPLAAATSELRERLSRQVLTWGREHLTRQLSEAFIKEVGRAAIDLYGGRIETAAQRAGVAPDATPGPGPEPAAPPDQEPLAVLVAGPDARDLMTALAGGQGSRDWQPPTDLGLPPARLHRGEPGDAPRKRQRLLHQVDASDLIIWAVPAIAAGRTELADAARDAATLLAARAGRHAPPAMVVVYGLAPDTAPALRVATLGAVATAFAVETAAIVALPSAPLPANLGGLWQRIAHALPAAQRARTSRHRQAGRPWSWSRLGSQAANAGKTLARTLARR